MKEVFDPEIGVTFVDLSSGRDLNRDGILQESEWEFTTQIYNGTNGIDGKSVVINTERNTSDTGTIVIFGYLVDQNFDEINRIEVLDGEDGVDGSNTLVTRITTITEGEDCLFGGTLVEVGYIVDEVFQVEDSFEVCNGYPGPQGPKGEDGDDGFNGDGTICIEHQLIGSEKVSDFGDNVSQVIEVNNKTYVVLTLTFSEFVYHTYEHHAGSSSQGNHDSWYDCDTL